MNPNVLIDSGLWIEYFAKGPLLNKVATHISNARPETHITPTIVIYEVYKKLKREKGNEVATKAIAYISNYTTVVTFTREVALLAADISMEKKFGMADSIIEATANAYNAKIVTSDPDFEGTAGVVFIKK